MAASFLWLLIFLLDLSSLLQAAELGSGDKHARQHFNEDELQTLDGLSETFLRQPHDHLWPVVPQVFEYYPLIFFHQRKAGGTSLRDTLYEASAAMNLTRFMPCYDDMPCTTFSIDKKAVDRAVYAGHFSWGDQAMLALHHRTYRSYFSCYTNFRHPIERIESCLYFRFTHMLQSLCLNDYPMPMFSFLLNQVDTYGNSCFNEPFRVLSGEKDEVVLDHLVDGDSEMLFSAPPPFDPKYSKEKQRRLLHDSSMHIFKTTLQHTVKCSPVINELPESYGILNHRYPGLAEYHAFEAEKKVRLGKKRERCEPVSGVRRAMIEKRAALEILLYEAVYRKTLKHMQHVGLNTGLALHPMVCRRSEYVEKTLLPQARQSMTLMLGRQSMRSVLFRSMLETMTGTYSGSRARKESATVRKFLPLHQECNRNMSFIYTQPHTMQLTVTRTAASAASLRFTPILATPSSVSSQSAAQQQSSQPCEGQIDSFSQAIVLLKDPFYMAWELFQVTTSQQAFNLSTYQYVEDPALTVLYRHLRKHIVQTVTNTAVGKWLSPGRSLSIQRQMGHHRHPNFVSLTAQEQQEYEEKHVLLFDVGSYFLLFRNAQEGGGSTQGVAVDYITSTLQSDLLFVSMEAVVSSAAKTLLRHQNSYNNTTFPEPADQRDAQILHNVLSRLGSSELQSTPLDEQRVICSLLHSQLAERELSIYQLIYKFYTDRPELLLAVQQFVRSYLMNELHAKGGGDSMHFMYPLQ